MEILIFLEDNSVLVSVSFVWPKYPTRIIWRKKGLCWVMVTEIQFMIGQLHCSESEVR